MGTRAEPVKLNRLPVSTGRVLIFLKQFPHKFLQGEPVANGKELDSKWNGQFFRKDFCQRPSGTPQSDASDIDIEVTVIKNKFVDAQTYIRPVKSAMRFGEFKSGAGSLVISMRPGRDLQLVTPRM